MDGRAFLEVARELASGATEAHWRTAAGRAYYALLLEGRARLQRWGFVATPRESMHTFVRLKFLYAGDPDLKRVGRALDRLSQLRNEADYQPASPGSFATACPGRTWPSATPTMRSPGWTRSTATPPAARRPSPRSGRDGSGRRLAPISQQGLGPGGVVPREGRVRGPRVVHRAAVVGAPVVGRVDDELEVQGHVGLSRAQGDRDAGQPLPQAAREDLVAGVPVDAAHRRD